MVWAKAITLRDIAGQAAVWVDVHTSILHREYNSCLHAIAGIMQDGAAQGRGVRRYSKQGQLPARGRQGTAHQDQVQQLVRQLQGMPGQQKQRPAPQQQRMESCSKKPSCRMPISCTGEGGRHAAPCHIRCSACKPRYAHQAWSHNGGQGVKAIKIFQPIQAVKVELQLQLHWLCGRAEGQRSRLGLVDFVSNDGSSCLVLQWERKCSILYGMPRGKQL